MDMTLNLDTKTEAALWQALEAMNDGLTASGHPDQTMTLEEYIAWLIRDAMAQRRLSRERTTA